MSIQKKQRIACAAFYFFMMLLGLFAFVYIVTYHQSDSVIFPIITVVMFVVAILTCVVNIIILKVINNKYVKDNAAKMMSIANNLREKALQDYVATEKAVIRSKNLLIFSKVMLSLYFFAMLVVGAFGATDNDSLHICTSIISIIGIIIYPMPVLDFFLGGSNVRPPEFCLDRNQFPLLFAVVDEAKKTLKCNKPYKITPVIGSGISVSAYNGGFYVSLDVEETAILTRDELYQVMLHEIAHVMNSDTKRTLRLEKFASQLDTRWGSISAATFFGVQVFNFFLKKEAYYVFCNIFYEQNADKAIKEYGEGQTYINATAKTMMLTLYKDEFNPEIDFDIHKEENIPKDYLFYDLQVYEKLLEKHSDKWNYLLTHRIPSRIDSHPTFAMRMEFVGVDSYDYKQKETDGHYVIEQKRLLRWGCDYLLKYTNKDFRRAREEYYIPTVRKVRKYRDAVEAGAKLSVIEKCEYIEMFFNIDRDECLKLCNEVLADLPRNAYANFYKGHILARNLNKDCVEHLYIAAEENSNFAESCYNTIGAFACNVGDKELLESYRERVDKEIVDVYKREREAVTLSKDDFIRANALPKQDYDNVLNFILSSGKKIVNNVYSVSRGEGKDMRTFYYIEMLPNTPTKVIRDFFDKVFNYLDMYVSADGVQHSFSLFSEFSDLKMIRIIEDTPSSLIYSHDSHSK